MKFDNDTNLQPILLTKEQYKELLRAINTYAFVKQSGSIPDLKSAELGAYLMDQGSKFGFEKEKMDKMEWFDQINDEVFGALFDYVQEEVWRNLASVLASRDTKREFEDRGIPHEKASTDDFLDATGVKVQKYLKEFEQNGVKNLSLNIK